MIAYKKAAAWLRSTRISILSLTALNVILLSLFVVQSCKKEFPVQEQNEPLSVAERTENFRFIQEAIAANPVTVAYIAELGALNYDCASYVEAPGQFVWAQIPIIAPGANSIGNLLEVIKFSNGKVQYKIHNKKLYQIQSQTPQNAYAADYFKEILKKFDRLESQCGLKSMVASDRLLELIYLRLENGDVWIYDPNTGALYPQGGGGGGWTDPVTGQYHPPTQTACDWSSMTVTVIYQGGTVIWTIPNNSTAPGGWGWSYLNLGSSSGGFSFSFPHLSGGGGGGTYIEPGGGHINLQYEDVHIVRKAQAIIAETYGLHLDINTLIHLFGLDCILELGSRNLPAGQYYAESDCVEEVLAANPFICLTVQAATFGETYHIDLINTYPLISIACNLGCNYYAFENCALGQLAMLKHQELTGKYSEYASHNINITAFIAQNGAKKYLATATLYEAFQEAGPIDFPDLETLQFYMEVFETQLLPIGITFIPWGIGDLADIYQSCGNGGLLSWDCALAIAGVLVPFDELVDLWKHSDEVFAAWKVTKSMGALKGAWTFIGKCTKEIRTNPTILNGIQQAIDRGIKSLDDIVAHAGVSWIDNATVQHMFRGDAFNSGRHHISAIQADQTIQITHISRRNADGFYVASMQKNGTPPLTMNDKSFWPDAWDENKIMDEIKFAFPNKTLIETLADGSKKYKGFTSTGQEITILMLPNGKLKTAYPNL